MNHIKFAALISYITAWTDRAMDAFDIEQIERLVGDLIPNPIPAVGVFPSSEIIEEARRLYWGQKSKIEAIKFVRAACKCGLKDAKDFVEALAPYNYYMSKSSEDSPRPETP